jgi:prefoldin alpha subunit
MDPNAEEHVRRLLMQLETGRRQMDQLNRQAQLIEAASGEISSTLEALDAIKGQSSGVETLVPVGSGSYVRGKLLDTESVVVGVGAGIYVEKRLPDAIEFMEGKRKQLLESYSTIQRTSGELAVKIAELNSQAEQMMGPQ